MNRWSALVVLLAIAGALLLRIPQLDVRPLHNDEAVNATKVAELWEHGRYRYDPDEYHGPTLHYATLPFLWLTGAGHPNDWPDRTLRLAPIAFGVALILLLLLLADAIGPVAVAWSAIFVAISPAMVFYSRYFIHEMLLVFFTALLIGAGWRYARTRCPGWAAVAGASVGLMWATKETFVITLGAMFLAAVGTIALSHLKSASEPSPQSHPRVSQWPSLLTGLVRSRDIAIAFSAGALAWMLFFSSFFTNFDGLLDSVRTYLPWLKRAAGHSPHIHPWYFYLERMGWFHSLKGPVWSEGLILGLAAIGGLAAFSKNGSPFLRFLTLYTVILTAAYSAISYKTPWCLLSFLHGLILLAGVGAATLMRCARAPLAKLSVIAVLLALAAQLTVQSWRTSFAYASDRRNPYVYAQTVPDLLKLIERAEGVAKLSPTGFDTIVKVIAPDNDYWPLPWSLRRFKNVGWYDTLPDDPFAPIMIVAFKLDARLDERSERKWIMVGISELRPGKFFELYIELPLWAKYVDTLPPEPE